ncbi:MAG TPA: type VI secretion system baseplate subunit TssF [Telluria sp.]|nr:type VI secretion system baseplate subunit TssF [Telluria sp.]
MIDSILPYYEREHANIAAMVGEFVEQYPQLAGVLGLKGTECTDPGVQRIVAAMVMLGAKILKQLEDNYPQFTEALLGINYPHYIQPFPSTSVVRIDYSGADAKSVNEATVVPRGTRLNSAAQDGLVCQFRTVYPVTVAPVRLASVRFASPSDKPAGIVLPVGTTAIIDIIAEGLSATQSLRELELLTLRVFIDGEPSLRAALRDALFIHTMAAYVEGDDGRWVHLKQVPIAPAGFAADEALIPSKAASHPGYRLLTEYFACPEKFNFFDIDMASLCKHLSPQGRRLGLHLAVRAAESSSATARVLQPLSNENLVLACTPVINLLARAASPIDLTHTKADYELLACTEHAAAFDIHSIDAVRVVRDTPKGAAVTRFYPYYSLRHGLAGIRTGHYYTIRRDELMARTNPGHETRIALVDIDLDPLAVETATVSIDLSCTNRDLPASLPVGAPAGDLRIEGCPNTHPIRLLRKPTPTYRFPPDAHWRLIAMLSLNLQSVVNPDLETFTELLTLHNLSQSSVTLRQIGGVTAISHTSARAWLQDAHGGARAHGIEVRLTLDEAAYVGSGIHAFAQVIDHFLGLNAHLNTFTQLTVVSQSTGKELIRCLPRSGYIALASSSAC